MARAQPQNAFELLTQETFELSPMPKAWLPLPRWFADLPPSSALVTLRRAQKERSDLHSHRLTESQSDLRALHYAHATLFASKGLPLEAPSESICWRRDALGKPYAHWQGEAFDWAQSAGYSDRFLHLSNTHDGDAHFLLAIYSEALIGIGIDVVHLPRLRKADRDREYLLRFAQKFMSEAEWSHFAPYAHNEDEESLRIRVAAHFSLMEAASKACGTGLKMGLGMGKATSLPKQSLGVKTLAPTATLLVEGEGAERLRHLGANAVSASWGIASDYLLSVVLLHLEA